jgi:hypothetical protein
LYRPLMGLLVSDWKHRCVLQRHAIRSHAPQSCPDRLIFCRFCQSHARAGAAADARARLEDLHTEHEARACAFVLSRFFVTLSGKSVCEYTSNAQKHRVSF